LENINHPEIWEKYFEHNENKINIYCHPKYPDKVSIPWLKKNIIPGLVETEWGLITDAYYQLLNTAFKDKSNMKFITISESCIPLRCFDDLYSEIIENTENENISYIKLWNKITNYDLDVRIKTQNNYENYNFIKHYARFCLSRQHTELLLTKKKDFISFFNKMHVGDEFFLSLLYPLNNYKNREITFDNWDLVKKKVNSLKNKINRLWKLAEERKLKDLNKNSILVLSKKNKNKNKNKNKKNNNNSIKFNKFNKFNKNRLKKNICNENDLTKNELKKLALLKKEIEDLNKNPYTYNKISTEDIKEARRSNAFFWRKISKKCEIKKFYPELLKCFTSKK
jgi:hypothetical protein